MAKGIDRISSLPKPLISHILSFLPTKYAVATSLLSRRWRFLWASIINLDLDDADILCKKPNKSLDMERKIFTQFVNRVLLQLNSPCIQNFHLKLHKHLWDPLYLNSWIYAAFGRTAQELHLDLELGKPMELPFSHFYCKSTLAVLKLTGSLHFNIAASSSRLFPNLQTLHLFKVTFTITSLCSVSFPSLKELVLHCVEYTTEESSSILFASCPVLDNLVLDKCVLGHVCCLVIGIGSFKSHKITFGNIQKDHDGCAPKLWLDTPSLKCLDLVGSRLYFSGENLSSLDEARLKYIIDSSITIDRNSIYAFDLIPRFNMKSLSFSDRNVKAIGSISASNFAPAGFSNLLRLEFDRNFCHDWSVFRSLLESMHNLEHLVMKGRCRGNHKSWWTEPLHVPICLLWRVTKISFSSGIGECSSKLELVRYFLKNAKVLQQLTVHVSGSSAAEFKLIQNISMMPRGSQTCKVAFEGLEKISINYQ